MSKLIDRLCVKIKDELGIECDPTTFKRTRAGYWQRASGAWSWFIQTKNSRIDIGSSEPVTECVKKKWELCRSGEDREIYLRKRPESPV